MDEKLITIKEVSLNNNCPECYNTNGLQLTFKQKFKETRFYKSITNETTQEIECKTCKSIIYPERWTEAIERVFDYHQKAFMPKPSSTRLKKAAWILIIALGILVVSAIVLTFIPNL